MFVISSQGGERPSTGRPALSPALVERARPISNASARLLPLPSALLPLFPDAALRRGTTTVVTGAPGRGATTLALALLASASSAAGWCAVVGLADPGVVAMVELDIDLRRVVFVPRPKARWADAAAELLDGVDVVLVRPPGRARSVATRRLVARARERRVALVVLVDRAGDWPEGPDVTLSVTAAEWHGIGDGHGHLRGRRAEVQVAARRSAGPVTTRTLWLPSRSGAVAPVESAADQVAPSLHPEPV